MSGTGHEHADGAEAAAFRRGRSQGLATAAVAIGAVAFINLFGAEKGILAAALGLIAMRSDGSRSARRRAGLAIGLGGVQLVTVAVVLVLFREELAQLLALLRTLG